MTNREYESIKAIRRSELYDIYKLTPKHFLYNLTHKKETPSLNFGSAMHERVAGAREYEENVAVVPKVDRRTKDGKEQYNTFLETAQGKIIITEEEATIIDDMWNELASNPIAMQFLDGIHEQPFFWLDDDTGITCKCKPDVIAKVNGKKYIVDYKTTDSCADGHFERSAKKYGYQFQAGMYREGVFLNTFEDYGFAFVAQEKTPPYAVRVYICDEQWIQDGADQFHDALHTLSYCQSTGNYYGYEGMSNTADILGGGADD